MKRKLLDVNDLYKYFVEQGKSITFSSKDDETIVVNTRGTLQFEESDDSEGLLYCKCRAFHDLDNVNKSFIDKDIFEKRLSTMKDRPILASIVDTDEVDDDGNPVKDFNGHDISVDDETGKPIYIEQPVGHFVNPENFHMEYDEKFDKDFAVADVVIYEEYSDACDILRRRGEVDCSVELSVRSLSYDAKNKLMVIDDFYVSACTLLGNGLLPGMPGSKVSIEDFSARNNSLVFDREDMINEIISAVMSRLNDKQNSKEGGNAVSKFEELLSKYGKTVKDITFDYEGMSDEELEQKFAELFDTAEGDPSGEGEDPEDDDNGNGEGEPEPEGDPVEEPDGEANEFSVSGTVEFAGRKLEFSRSFQDTIGALTELVNSTYAEADNDYYDVDVYGDDKYVVMKGWWTGKAYKQTYKVKKDVFTLTSDRVPVYPQYLTEDEMAKLDDMRSNYSKFEEVESKLKKYEDEPQKLEILNSNDYAGISEIAEFAELKEMKNHFDLTVDELKDKCDKMLLNAAKTGTFNFAKSQESEKNGISILFGTKAVQKGSFLDELMNMKKN